MIKAAADRVAMEKQEEESAHFGATEGWSTLPGFAFASLPWVHTHFTHYNNKK